MKKNLPLIILLNLIAANLSFAQVAAPVNDQCANAVIIPPSTSLTCTGATVFHNLLTNPSGAGVVPLPGCGNFTDGVTPDLWFKFTAGGAAYHQVEMDTENTSGATDLAMALYTGGCNGPWNLLACDDNSNGANMPMAVLNNLALGTVVYIRVWSNNGTSPGNFRICVAMYNTTDIQQQELESVYLFPNPFENVISFSSPVKNSTVRIFDSMGAEVLMVQKDEFSEIDTSHLKAGLYVLEIISGNNSSTKKVIKL